MDAAAAGAAGVESRAGGIHHRRRGPAVDAARLQRKDGLAIGTLTGVAPAPEAPPVDWTPSDWDPAKLFPKPVAFLTLAADAQVAAAPYMLMHPSKRLPMVLLLFNDIAKGASATLVVHSAEPTVIPAVAALPNLIQIAPVAPITPPRH